MPRSRPAKDLMATAPRLAVDIGGTFTDIALTVAGQLFTAKTLTTSLNPVDGVLDGIRIVCNRANCPPSSVTTCIHGTTLATNALIEHKGAKVGLITTEGFRDIVEIAYERRYDQYDIYVDKPDLLVTREQCWTIPERINAKGETLKALDSASLDVVLPQMLDKGIESIAVCLLHSYINPEHERKLGDLIQAHHPGFPITLSSDVCPELREFDRACTAIANAYIKPLMQKYLRDLATALQAEGFDCPLLIVTSGGGMTTLATAAQFPIRLVESGPSGGAILAAEIAGLCKVKRAVSFDMGGTTAKLCLIDDATPQRSRQFEVARAERFIKGSGLPIRIPVVEMIEIGAGGGSIARVDGLGRLVIGPDSAGATPGPVCYGQGGVHPTVTDADVALGFIDPRYFAENRVKLKPRAGSRAIKSELGVRLGLNIHESAYGISQMVDENMANAARVHGVEHGTEITHRTLIAFGGNGPLHATRVADKTGIDHIVIPRNPGVGSAIGFLNAPISYEIIRSLYMLLSRFDLAEVKRLFLEMELEARSVVEAGSTEDKLVESRFAFMRYEGQGHEIQIPLPAGTLPDALDAYLGAKFEQIYEQTFGRTVPSVDIEIMNWGVVTATPVTKRHPIPSPRRRRKAMPKGLRKIYWGQSRRRLEVPFYHRADLSRGDYIDGPALIVESQTTTLVSPAFNATIDAADNIVMRRHK